MHFVEQRVFNIFTIYRYDSLRGHVTWTKYRDFLLCLLDSCISDLNISIRLNLNALCHHRAQQRYKNALFFSFSHIKANETKLDLAVKKVKVNPGSLFKSTL